MNTKNCPKCGKELPLEAVFCPYCMTKLIDVKTGKSIKVKKKNYVLPVIIFTSAVLIVVSVVLFLLTGNAEKTNLDDHYESYTEKITEPSETTESHSNENDSELSYIVIDFGDFYADVPKNWIYNTESRAIYFYEEFNYTHGETGSTGYLCDIRGIDLQNSDTPSPNSRFIGGTGKTNYYAEFPMGMGVIEDELASQKMQIAYGQVEDFIDSIIFK